MKEEEKNEEGSKEEGCIRTTEQSGIPGTDKVIKQLPRLCGVELVEHDFLFVIEPVGELTVVTKVVFTGKVLSSTLRLFSSQLAVIRLSRGIDLQFAILYQKFAVTIAIAVDVHVGGRLYRSGRRDLFLSGLLFGPLFLSLLLLMLAPLFIFLLVRLYSAVLGSFPIRR